MKKENNSALKNSFDELNLDDKAAFLVQAAFSTASSALEEIGHRFNDLVDALSSDEEEEAEAEEAPPAKAKATTSRRKSTSSKRTSTKRSTKKDD